MPNKYSLADVITRISRFTAQSREQQHPAPTRARSELPPNTEARTCLQREIACRRSEERIQFLHALPQPLLVLALGVVFILPRASIAQHLRGPADILRRGLEELRPGETLVFVPRTQSVDIVLESSVLGHGAECNQDIAESMLAKVVRRPLVFLRIEALSDGVGEVRIVLLGAAHVACSG